jgi:hypothetical protein
LAHGASVPRETLTKAKLEYGKPGATSLSISRYNPLPDAIQYGEEMNTRVRELVADYHAAGEGVNHR